MVHIVDQMSRARRPWMVDVNDMMYSEESGGWIESDLPRTPQDRIDRCLSCKRSRCTDCRDDDRAYGRPRREEERIYALIVLGLTNQAIADQVGVTTRTVTRARARLRREGSCHEH